jgi:hypothetical protein
LKNACPKQPPLLGSSLASFGPFLGGENVVRIQLGSSNMDRQVRRGLLGASYDGSVALEKSTGKARAMVADVLFPHKYETVLSGIRALLEAIDGEQGWETLVVAISDEGAWTDLLFAMDLIDIVGSEPAKEDVAEDAVEVVIKLRSMTAGISYRNGDEWAMLIGVGNGLVLWEKEREPYVDEFEVKMQAMIEAWHLSNKSE